MTTSQRPYLFIITIAAIFVACTVVNITTLQELNQKNSTTSDDDSEAIHKTPGFFLQLTAAFFKILWEISDLIGIKHFPLPSKLLRKITTYRNAVETEATEARAENNGYYSRV